MSAQHLTKKTNIPREMLCGHSADIVRTYVYLQGYMSALYPSSVFTSDINEQKLSVQRRSLSEQVDQNKSPHIFWGKIDININITNKVIKIHNKICAYYES